MKLIVSTQGLANRTIEEIEKSDEPSGHSWCVTDLPLALYEEVCRHFGKGEEERYKNDFSPTGIPSDNYWWRKRHLDPEHPMIGKPVTIMVQKINECMHFKFWNRDTSVDNYFASDYPLIGISAGPQSVGIWAYGHGNLIADCIDIKFNMDIIPLSDPTLQIAGLIIFRASQLVQNPNCIKNRYWEFQINPNGDYTKLD